MDLGLNGTYSVEIPYRKDLGSWPFYQYDMDLSPPLRKWLWENISNKWIWEEIPALIDDSIILRFYFANKNDALLFKLAWGGE